MISQISAAAFLAWVPLLLGLAAPGGTSAQPSVTRMMVQEQLIIKIPVRPQPGGRALDYETRKGPKCLDTKRIRGAVLAGPSNVDFAMVDRTWVRAQFNADCPALDFYRGFYLKPEDERLCAKRDFVHSRMGGSCQIQQFRGLKSRGGD